MKLGADHVFDTNDPDITEKAKKLGGVDVVLELVGGDSFARSLAMLNSFGRMSVIGALEEFGAKSIRWKLSSSASGFMASR